MGAFSWTLNITLHCHVCLKLINTYAIITVSRSCCLSLGTHFYFFIIIEFFVTHSRPYDISPATLIGSRPEVGNHWCMASSKYTTCHLFSWLKLCCLPLQSDSSSQSGATVTLQYRRCTKHRLSRDFFYTLYKCSYYSVGTLVHLFLKPCWI